MPCPLLPGPTLDAALPSSPWPGLSLRLQGSRNCARVSAIIRINLPCDVPPPRSGGSPRRVPRIPPAKSTECHPTAPFPAHGALQPTVRPRQPQPPLATAAVPCAAFPCRGWDQQESANGCVFSRQEPPRDPACCEKSRRRCALRVRTTSRCNFPLTEGIPPPSEIHPA